MVIRSCTSLCQSLVPILGIEVWGLGLRWDDDAVKSRIMYFGMRVHMFEEDEVIE